MSKLELQRLLKAWKLFAKDTGKDNDWNEAMEILRKVLLAAIRKSKVSVKLI